MSLLFIRFHEVSVTLGDRRILEDMRFSIHQGDMVALIGPNGAGKSTLLKTLMGFIPSFSGEIHFKGRPLQHYSIKERARSMAYIPQLQTVEDSCTVYDFVSMGRYPYLGIFKTLGQHDRDIIAQALVRTGVESLSKRTLNTLSGGERQKVFIAAALAQQTEILILDEPCAFLDIKSQLEIETLLQEIHQTLGTTLVMSTHDVNRALALSQKMICLKEGRIFYSGMSAEMVCPEKLSQFYETDFIQCHSDDMSYRHMVPITKRVGR